jgi:hypothetical protein
MGLYQGSSWPGYYYLFPTLKPKVRGYRFKDDRKAEPDVTRRLVIKDTEFCQQRREKLVVRYDKSLSYDWLA